MNSRQIEAIRAILHYGTLTRAAEVLNISQSALSQLLLRTEDQTGPLFERQKGRLVPTARARQLAPEVDRVYEHLERLRWLVHELRTGEAAPVRINTSPPLLLPLVPPLMQMIKEGQLDVQIEVEVNQLGVIWSSLREDDSDMGLTMIPNPAPDLLTEVIGQVNMVCLFPEGHPLADQPEIHVSQVVGLPIISYRRNNDFGILLERVFSQEGYEFRPSIEVDHSMSSVVFVQQNLGVAVVEGASPWRRFAGVVQRPLTPRISLPICVHYGTSRDRSHGCKIVEHALRVIISQQLSPPAARPSDPA